MLGLLSAHSLGTSAFVKAIDMKSPDTALTGPCWRVAASLSPILVTGS